VEYGFALSLAAAGLMTLAEVVLAPEGITFAKFIPEDFHEARTVLAALPTTLSIIV
jgi:hypothetical protein